MNIQHSCGSVEYYTPHEYVEAAREALGGIDLDPASCVEAQVTVQASAWYGVDSPFGTDGLREPWLGRVFLNPPGGRRDNAGRPVYTGCIKDGSCGLSAPHKHLGVRSSAALWWAMLASYYQRGEVEAAVFVGFSLELLQSCQVFGGLQPLACSFCIPRQRIAFVGPGKKIEGGPTHANVLVYLGLEPGRFVRAFEGFGLCRV